MNLRLWTQKELVEALLANYQALDERLKAERPPKRIWTVAKQVGPI
jgi:restriction system protein